MNTKDYVKKIALGTCVYYTAATFLVLFLYFALNLDLSGGMQALALIAILPFAFCFSAANTLYRHATLPRWLRVIVHYALTVGGAFLFLYLPNKDPQQTAKQALILFLVFSILYAMIMGVVLLVGGRVARVKCDEEKYHNVYKK